MVIRFPLFASSTLAHFNISRTVYCMSEADTLIVFSDYFSLRKLREHWAGVPEKNIFRGPTQAFFVVAHRVLLGKS